MALQLPQSELELLDPNIGSVDSGPLPDRDPIVWIYVL